MANIINAATMDLIKAFEGLRTLAYPDPATGGEPWTIGYGHTTAAGPPTVAKGLQITADMAEAILIRDLEAVARHVRAKVKVPLNDNQFGGLVSFTFNCGPANFDKSTLLKKVNAKDFAGAVMEFAKWARANKKIMPGLMRRRAAEANLFLAPPTIAKNATVAPAPRMAPFPPTSVHQPHPPAGPVAADFEPTPTRRKPKTLVDILKGFFIRKAVDTAVNHAKDEKMFSFLSGYKTYVIGLFMALVAVAQIAGIDLPAVEGQNAGQLLMEAFGLMFLRAAVAKV